MKVCKLKDCNEEHHGRGYCNKHHRRLLRYGRIYRTINDPNEIVIEKNFVRLFLYNSEGKKRAEVIIDTDDVEKVRNHKWHFDGDSATTQISKRKIRLSHMILGRPKKGMTVVFKNGDNLDYRKSNLKFAKHFLRIAKREYKKNTSGYRGVSWASHAEKWRAQISADKKHIHLGYFSNKKEAARVYNEAGLKYFGEFAVMNKT